VKSISYQKFRVGLLLGLPDGRCFTGLAGILLLT